MRKIALASLALLFVWALPGQAINNDVPPGQLVKAESSSAVYYVDVDLHRHVFPNARVFRSWYDSFNEIITLTDAEISEFPLAGTVPYKPGKRLVKIQTDPKVYVVDDGGELRWLKHETLARALYGENWNQMIDDLSDAFFANYTLGEEVDEAADFDPQMKRQGKRIKDTLEAKRLKWQNRHGNQAGKAAQNEGNGTGGNMGFGQDKVAVCHNFGQNNPHTIYIAKPALQAHLALGDTEGACSGDADDGDNGDENGDDEEPADTTAPVISSVNAFDITASSATVSWATDESSSYSLYYDESSAPAVNGQELESSVLDTLHQVVIDGLNALTQYFYQIVAEDEAGNQSESAIDYFTTASAA